MTVTWQTWAANKYSFQALEEDFLQYWFMNVNKMSLNEIDEIEKNHDFILASGF